MCPRNQRDEIVAALAASVVLLWLAAMLALPGWMF